MNQAEQQACASVAEQIGDLVAEHAARQKHQPVIIEVTRFEGDNELSFAVRGSSEWLQEMLPFVMFHLGTLTKHVWESADEAQRQDLLDGINALQRRESYQGEFVKVTIAQEPAQ